MMKSLIQFTLFVFLILPIDAGAQSKGKAKRTTINFEDQLIKGQNQKPDLLYLLQKKQFNYKRLIRLRENFLPEMRETSTEIQEGRKVQLKKPEKE